jgi:predicted enzyme related to lactoylglutathione lyase
VDTTTGAAAAPTGTAMTTQQEEFGLSEIGQIAINVADLRRAVAFYRDTLGMRFLFEAPGGLAFFDCGGIRLMLGVAEKAEFNRPASILYYKVDDINAAYATLMSRGVSFIDAPHLIAKLPAHELWMSFFRDSEDNVLALMEERKA